MRYAIRHRSTVESPGHRGAKFMGKLVKMMIKFSSIIGGTRLSSQRIRLSFNGYYVLS